MQKHGKDWRPPLLPPPLSLFLSPFPLKAAKRKGFLDHGMAREAVAVEHALSLARPFAHAPDGGLVRGRHRLRSLICSGGLDF